jgi:hypothetical protein
VQLILHYLFLIERNPFWENKIIWVFYGKKIIEAFKLVRKWNVSEFEG